MDKDLRFIFEAATEEEGYVEFEEFSEELDERYPNVSASWKNTRVRSQSFSSIPPGF